MKTQKKLIEYYTQNFNKVIQFHGVNSDAATTAFFLLQAVKINMPENQIFEYANKQCENLQELALELNRKEIFAH